MMWSPLHFLTLSSNRPLGDAPQRRRPRDAIALGEVDEQVGGLADDRARE